LSEWGWRRAGRMDGTNGSGAWRVANGMGGMGGMGEGIGIVSGDQIVALRPATVSSDDYAWREHGVTPAEMKRFEERVEREIASERKRGKVKRFSGNLEKDLAG
jgi:hypothetical protein